MLRLFRPMRPNYPYPEEGAIYRNLSLYHQDYQAQRGPFSRRRSRLPKRPEANQRMGRYDARLHP